MSLRALAICAAVSTIFLAGCKDNKAPPASPAEAQEAAAVAAEAAAAVPAGGGDASTPSAEGRSSPDCVGPLEEGESKVSTVAGKSYEQRGYKLTLQGDAPEKVAPVLGVLANLNDDGAANLFNIERYLAFFKEKQVDWIVVAGDSGEERAEIEGTLRAVAKAGIPILAIAGNRERTSDFKEALDALSKEHPNVFNGNRIRHLDLHGVDVITLPGYHDPRYIHQEGAGCQYYKRDVAELAKLAADANDPVLLLAHGQPKGKTRHALDVIAPEGEHIGDENLNEVIEEAKIAFGIFANVKEAGGKATADLGGEKLVEQGAKSDSLYLNPGAADSIEWVMNDGSSSFGSAAVLSFEGGQASYELYRAAKLTDAERAQAEKLVPSDRAVVQGE